MNKVIGYAITGIGLVLLGLTFKGVRDAIKLNLPGALTDTILTIISLVVLGLGIFMIVKTSKPNQSEEVPIYHGSGKHQTIVGYRRLGKK